MALRSLDDLRRASRAGLTATRQRPWGANFAVAVTATFPAESSDHMAASPPSADGDPQTVNGPVSTVS